MEIAVLTMVHNEAALLRTWLDHYGAIFGRPHLYVMVHGEEPAILAQLSGVTHIPLPRRRVNWKFERTRAGLVNAYADLLLDNYDAVIHTDVDEILVADPARGTLPELIAAARGDHPVLNPLGLQVVARPDDPAIPSDGAALFAARPVVFVDADYCKPCIAFDSPGWGRGFHSSRHRPALAPGLFLAHLKCASLGGARAVAEARAASVEGFDGIGNDQRQRWWTKGDRICRWMGKAAAKRPLVDLDDHLAPLAAELAANIAENRGGRPGFSCVLPELNLAHPYRVPDRFRALDVRLWA